MQTFIPTEEALRTTVMKAVEEAVSERLPEIVRKATQKQHYTIDEVCELLSVSRRHLTYLRESGQINYVKNGRKVYFKREDLDNFFDENYIEQQ
jgi:excisionase family DNA binding protein